MNKETMDTIIATFPKTFGLADRAGTFRINASYSYVNDQGIPTLAIDIKRSDAWVSYCKASPGELSDYITPAK